MHQKDKNRTLISFCGRLWEMSKLVAPNVTAADGWI